MKIVYICKRNKKRNAMKREEIKNLIEKLKCKSGLEYKYGAE